MNKHNSQLETLIEVRRLIVRYRWRFILPCFAVMLGVLTVALCLPRKYEAVATFERRSDLVLTEIAGRGAPQSYRQMRNTMNEELIGLPSVEKTISDLNLASEAGDGAGGAEHGRRELARQDLIQRVHRNLWLRYDISTPETDRVQIHFVDTDPDRARAIVNRLVENYIEHAREEVERMLGQAIEFFGERAREERAAIEALEEKRLRFELKHAELLPDDASHLLDVVTAMEQAVIQAEHDRRAAERRLATLVSQIESLDGDGPATIVTRRNPALAEIDKKLEDYRNRLERSLVLEKMTERHPDVVSVRAKITDLEAERAVLPEEVVAERVFSRDGRRGELELALTGARTDFETATTMLTTAEERLARMRARNAEVFPVRNEYRKIEREIERAQRQVAFWEDSLRRVETALDAELGQRGVNLEFIKPAARISRPSSPDFFQVVFAALVMGVLSGMGLMVLSERMDQRYQSVDQAVRHLEAPVIGTVAEILSRRHAALRRLWRLVVFPTSATVMAILVIGAVYLNSQHLNAPSGSGAGTVGRSGLPIGAGTDWLNFEIDLFSGVASRRSSP